MLNKFCIENTIGIQKYSTSQSGMGGIIRKKNEDFIVREILPSGKPIMTGSELGEDQGGMYTHCILWKSGLDTFHAVSKISYILRINENDIGYAGLKDAKAETYQRISIWNIDQELTKEINMNNLKLLNPIRQKFAIRIGDLIGNLFEIVIRDVQKCWTLKEWEIFKSQIESRGILNFFGEQRFGSQRPILHLIGKFLLQERYNELIDHYLGNLSPFENNYITDIRKQYLETSSYIQVRNKFPRKFSIERALLKGLQRNDSAKKIVLNLPKSFLRLSISAYQAFLFNKTLNYLTEDSPSLLRNKVVPLPGYMSKRQKNSEEVWKTIESLLDDDNLNFRSFKHEISSLRSKGSFRKAFFFPSDFKVFNQNKGKKSVKISFALKKGSYATIVTREIIKEGNKII